MSFAQPFTAGVFLGKKNKVDPTNWQNILGMLDYDITISLAI